MAGEEDDIRAVYGALDRCLQYGVDPFGWRMQLCIELAALSDAQVTLCGEVAAIWDDERAMVRHMVDHGWPSPEAQSHFVRYQIDGANRRDPMRRALDTLRSDVVVAACSQLIEVRTYRQSDIYRQYMAPAGIGDIMTAITAIGEVAEDRWNLATCMRPADAAPFSGRDRQRLGLIAAELRGLAGNRLADATSPVASLTDRHRQALGALLAGAREADAAATIGVRPGTFHGYVQSLYRTFGVSSRAELHSRFYGSGRLWDGGAAVKDSRRHRLRRAAMPMTDTWPGRTTFL
ncbi:MULTISPECIES: hypothetical protein [unclassified Roseitalea]|uniref:hypothetical protein n=1 Tax=unclassified Roseitalea TaxID=2639107 RepID=UPI00273D9929|nr:MULTISPECIES: hypothetical protein [unclassified Roseitalea]